MSAILVNLENGIAYFSDGATVPLPVWVRATWRDPPAACSVVPEGDGRERRGYNLPLRCTIAHLRYALDALGRVQCDPAR